MSCTELPSGTLLWLSTGSKEGDILVQLRQPLPSDMSAGEVPALDEQLATEAVALVNAALPAGRSATGKPEWLLRKRLTQVQAERQGGLPAAAPQTSAAPPAGPAGFDGTGIAMSRQSTWQCGVGS